MSRAHGAALEADSAQRSQRARKPAESTGGRELRRELRRTALWSLQPTAPSVVGLVVVLAWCFPGIQRK